MDNGRMPRQVRNIIDRYSAELRRIPRRRRRRNYKKKKYTVSRAKLLTKKVDTLVEHRMQEIAKVEVEKNLQVLTKRNYVFCDYDPVTNEFNELDGDATNSAVSWAGSGPVELTNIGKVDMAAILNVPQSDDPETKEDENLDGDGTNQVSQAQIIHGRRQSNEVFIKSLSAQVRISVDEIATQNTLLSSTKLKYGFYMYTGTDANMTDVSFEPAVNELITMNPFGYKSTLDKPLTTLRRQSTVRKLAEGTITISFNDMARKDIFRTIYKKFDRPIRIQYPPLDQNGQQANRKIYFCAKSTTPDAAGYDTVKPHLHVCTKLNYYEA